ERPRDARRRDAKPLAEPRGEGHPDRHGLSVEKLAIALRGLDSVSKRMPEIEDHPQIGLALILLDDARLDRHRSRDDIRKGAPIQSIESRTVGCHPLEEPGIANRGGLDHLGAAGTKLPRGESGEKPQIHRDRAGPQEHADEILSLGKIRARFSSDARIDPREKRRRHLDEGDAAEERSCGEAREVPDDTASEGDEETATVDPMPRSVAPDALERSDALRGLSRREKR